MVEVPIYENEELFHEVELNGTGRSIQLSRNRLELLPSATQTITSHFQSVDDFKLLLSWHTKEKVFVEKEVNDTRGVCFAEKNGSFGQ